MSDRSVSVTLRLAAASYIAGMQAAKKATRELSNETLKATKANHANLQTVGRAALIGGGGIAAGLALAVRAAMNFEKAMSGVRAVTGATAGQMGELKKAAIAAGQATIFSASDAANAEGELAKAGVSVADVLGGGLKGALNLAAAGQLGVADAANISATAMTQFGLAGKDVSHIADLMAAAANKAQGGVTDMATALKYVGPVAHQMGVSIDETVGTIAELAHNGILADQAGTSLRGMLTALTSPSKMAAAQMSQLGINVYDAAGNFVGFRGVADQLQKTMGGLSNAERDQALGRIFGNEQITAARVLYAGGAKDVDKWTKAVNDNGAAARIAHIQMDNLAGDLENLKGSIETGLIGAGSAGQSSLRGLTQAATGAVNTVSGLPGPIQKAGFALGGIGSAGLLAAGAIGTMLPKIRETRAALEGMGQAGTFASRGLGALGKAGVVGVAIVAVGESIHFLGDEITKLQGHDAPAVDALTNSLVSFNRTGRLSGAAMKGIGTDAGQLTSDLMELNSTGGTINKWAGKTSFGFFGRDFREAQARVDSLDAALAGLVASGHGDVAKQIFGDLAAQVNISGGSVDDFKASLVGYAAANANAATDAKLNADATTKVTGAMGAATEQAGLEARALANHVTPAIQAATEALTAYSDALSSTVAIDAYTANANLSKSFKDLSKEIKTAGTVTDAEKISLGGFAGDVRSTAKAVLDQSGSQDKANESMRKGRQRFIDLAEQAGYTSRQAKRLADRLLEIPARTDVQVSAPGLDSTTKKVLTYRDLLNALDGQTVRTKVVTTMVTKRVDLGGGYSVPGSLPPGATAPVKPRPKTVPSGVGVFLTAGGLVSGPGTATSDSIPALLSNGEFVVNAASTRAHRGLLEGINTGRVKAFADGGIVTTRQQIREYRRAPAAPTVVHVTPGGASLDMSGWQISAPSPIETAGAVARRLRDETWKAGWAAV